MALEQRFGAAAERFASTAGTWTRRPWRAPAPASTDGLAFRALSPELRERWFRPLPDGRRAAAPGAARARRFPSHQPARAAVAAIWGDQDLILFRNVSIYFDAAMRESVQRRLLALLRPGGRIDPRHHRAVGERFGLTEMREHQGTWYLVPG
jgi:chemotaxis protein methyltransferase CheR